MPSEKALEWKTTIHFRWWFAPVGRAVVRACIALDRAGLMGHDKAMDLAAGVVARLMRRGAVATCDGRRVEVR